ncbi:hypothetical protein HHJ81_07535 [Mobiluncus mulieris]|uniref:Uncharacterized protein n=2 Tax=Mobiluncus mulieris TaxID=2052 RepID=E0QSC8_9ACTO|nr:hypothetical protein HMPREF0577_1156 [Mobiluncus mulieris ATCC 35243]EFM45503.1 hypothetical protein HMPREF0580_1793 [Mobiluncus mulieris ATCC 35239]MCU9969001.1 hypothetical protein [Mobiluncus mulieris]MCU9971706.1 hypothetical protein [Mobiluncus mulieris]MCU9973690.1 hypothetical protein [Mobiluncus mulieris]
MSDKLWLVVKNWLSVRALPGEVVGQARKGVTEMKIKKMWKKLTEQPEAIYADVVLANAYATNMREEMFANR